ncbi:Zn-dependent hydrolase [Ureibacillus manganicus]|nr:Zn-dependent hydrolase [Ureibacillus manganicus]
MNLERLEKLFNTFNSYTDSGEGINRIAYTSMETSAKHSLMRLCMSKNMTVRMDEIGNVIARKEGKNPLLPAIAIGSHLDSVYNGGKYDGLAGVIAGIEVVTMLEEENILLEHPLEIISFACEESSRFGVSTIGSKVMTGSINANELRRLKDANQISFERAIEIQNLSLENLELAHRWPEEFKAFIELHIEQGPVLDYEGLDIGVVQAIAAPIRFEVNLYGQAAHSGTTPMHYRKDALVGASELILNLESLALKESVYGTVATVGVQNVKPGGMNIVPGEVFMLVDIRGIDMDSRKRVVDGLYDSIELLKKRRNLEIQVEKISEEKSVLMDSTIIDKLASVCEKLEYKHIKLSSGAGHDAMYMSKLTPTGMVFVPSHLGISHNPAEHTTMEQIWKVINVLKNCVIMIDREEIK